MPAPRSRSRRARRWSYIEYDQSPTSEIADLRFGSESAKVLAVHQSRVTAIVPSSVTPGICEVSIIDSKGKSATGQAEIAALAPAIVGGIQNENGGSNAQDFPALRGTFVTVYVTGEGQLGRARSRGRNWRHNSGNCGSRARSGTTWIAEDHASGAKWISALRIPNAYVSGLTVSKPLRTRLLSVSELPR